MTKGLRANELPLILWYTKLPRKSLQEKPLFPQPMEWKAMVSVEIGVSSTRKIGYDKEQNEEAINETQTSERKSGITFKLGLMHSGRGWKEISTPRFARKILKGLGTKESI